MRKPPAGERGGVFSHFVSVPDVYPISVTVSRDIFLCALAIFNRGAKDIDNKRLTYRRIGSAALA